MFDTREIPPVSAPTQTDTVVDVRRADPLPKIAEPDLGFLFAPNDSFGELGPPTLRGETEISVNGDPELGRIRFLRQVHTIYVEPEDELVVLGTVQLAIFEELRRLDAKHVFVEGLFRNLDSSNPDRREDLGRYQCKLLPLWMRDTQAADGFADRLADMVTNYERTRIPSRELLFFMGAIGGAFLYASSRPDVSLHRTVRQDTDDILAAKQRKAELTPEQRHFLTFEVRERLALNEIANFMRVNPGSDVVLVYGAAHDFADDVRRRWAERRPELVTECFPTVVEHFLSWKRGHMSSSDLLEYARQAA